MALIQRLLTLTFFIIIANTVQAKPTDSNNNEYKLSSGDTISITVFAEKDLSFKSIKLDESGRFSYPFIGEISAKGLTAAQLQQKLTRILSGDYLVNPKVSISILEYRQFYISGEVKDPDGYPYQPGLTVRRAIALAGGLTERASERKMTIIRESDPSKTPKYVNMEDTVMPGDTITIDQGFF
jgi:polysaccharide export outer membrane protein